MQEEPARAIDNAEAGNAAPRARLIAYYLPQYHVIPENEVWWGEEFTDWVNVRKARPLFSGHYQPRVPSGHSYYDLGNPDTLRWQIDLAKRFELGGFCHYHYWFEGRQLLERPTELMMAHRDLDFPFCLAWINASWSRRWKGDGGSSHVLVRQTYARDSRGWLEHFNYLCRAWADSRYITVNDEPVFLIHSPHAIPHLPEMVDFWRGRAREVGLPGIHLVAMQLFNFLGHRFLRHFDAVVQVQPASAMFIPAPRDAMLSTISLGRYLRGLSPAVSEPLRRLRYAMPHRLRFHDYDELWHRILEHQASSGTAAYAGAFVDWDNSARYGRSARVVRGATPERFYFWLDQLVSSLADRPFDRRLIFVNAWNEWAEGAYLEPDERYGEAYLEAVRDSVHPLRRRV